VDRVFLDANVLLAAAWRSEAALKRLWRLDDAELLSSHYAVGDWEHFGPYFCQEIGGVLILPPAEYPLLIPEE
jgi:hypothetical protein